MKYDYAFEGKKFFVVGSEKLEWPEIKRVAYVHHEHRVIIVWEGNRKKPVSNYHYGESDFENALNNEIKWSERRVKEIKDYEQRCKDECKSILKECKVGDVFYASWGHGQTNIDYFQVISIKGKKFSFRQLKSNCDYDGQRMTGYSLPIENEFYGDEVYEKSLSKYAVFKIDESRSLKREPFQIVDGKKVYEKRFYSTYA